jgi:methylated-DNA-[protein]-cysteine S-methyltransferase
MATSIYRPVLNIPNAELLGPFPELLLRSDERGRLIELGFLTANCPQPNEVDPEANAPVARQLDEYFEGRRTRFDLELAPKGTPFQLAVWQLLCDIPYGETRTYRDLAIALGKPTATRAVGAANGANPIAIIQACHRVIGTNGKLTGFAGGLATKAALLALERGGSAHRR